MKKNNKPNLTAGDLRSIGESNFVVQQIHDQESFDNLFSQLKCDDRLVVMRAADAIEKISLSHPEFLQEHKKAILNFAQIADHKEFKWHLALLLPRLKLTKKELGISWDILTRWVLEKKESKIVRVNSIQSLVELLQFELSLKSDLLQTIQIIEYEKIPSINARIRILKKKYPKILTN